MEYIIGQGFGILATVCCLIGPFGKKKWQMLVNSAAANLFVALNLLFIGEVSSALIINLVAIVQTGCSICHVCSEKPVKMFENIIFLIAYVVCGALGYKTFLDILPIIGAILFMLLVFQRDEQKTRLINLSNAAVYLLYYLLIGSASALAQVASIATTLAALYHYRKKAV